MRLSNNWSVKSFCDAQEAWQSHRMKTLFKTKHGFTETRRKSRASYNGRSAYMRTHGLNAVSVKEPWNSVKAEGNPAMWRGAAARMSQEGNNVYVVKTFY